MSTGIHRLQIGTRFHYDGTEWTAVGLHGATIRARSESNVLAVLSLHEVIEHATLLGIEEVEDDAASRPHLIALHHTTREKPNDKAVARQRAVQLLLTGTANGLEEDSDEGRKYGPASGLTQTQRIEAYARDHGIGISSLHRWIRQAREHGTDGLIDKRHLGIEKPYGNCPQEVIDAMRFIASQQADLSRVTDRALIQQVQRLVQERHGDAVTIPSRRSLYRYWSAMKDEFSLHLAKQTQRSNSVRPKHIGQPLSPSRPFEIVEIDSTRLDLLAISPIDGRPVPVSLTIAIDLYTRSIVAARFAPVAEKGTDAALLLYDMMTPKLWHESWGEGARWRYGIPENLVLPDNVSTITPIAGVPIGSPATLSLDNGAVYTSGAMKSAAIRLGINLQYSRKKRPTDKPHVERTFGTIRSRFVQYLPGFTGSRVDDRGSKESVDDAACLLIPELESLFAQWVAVEYQNTPHKGLFNPMMPNLKMTPNEAYDIGIATTGYVPILADRELAISLLPSTARKVGTIGVQLNSLAYDSPHLDPYRGRKSPFSELEGKWPVRYDSRDLSHIWVWLGDAHDRLNGHWVRIPARITRVVGAFSDIHLAYAKSLFTNEDKRATREEMTEAIEATMVEMFERISTFGPANPREETVIRYGHDRVLASTATFPHDADEIDIHWNDWEADETGDLTVVNFDDIEPYEMGVDGA